MSTRSSPAGPRFLADVMLGSLARWLRILGYDTEYDNRISDDEIVRRCIAEGRVALTRDVRLTERRRLRSLLIESNQLGAQIREVLRFLGAEVEVERILTRCLQCNSPLLDAARDALRDRVPPYIYETQSKFKHCPACDRVYWGGTHRDHILARLKKLTAATDSTGEK
jgi:uncharacterized protein